MKTCRHQIEEVRVIGPEKKRFKTLDFLTNTGYTILKVGPAKHKNRWSWDLKKLRDSCRKLFLNTYIIKA